jgi:cytochrome c553
MENTANQGGIIMRISSILALSVSAVLLHVTAVHAQPDLGIARYTENGELLFPADTARWIHAGSVLGGRYAEGEAAPAFDPQNPDNSGVVQMEPEAWQYFMEHGEYADGTMFLLSFYKSEAKSNPQLNGFVQGDLQAQEIHVIDKGRFTEGRGFFLFDAPAQRSSSKVPDGSTCVACHSAEGNHDGTFTQFYPHLRARLAD